jgi:hypothetical protein
MKNGKLTAQSGNTYNLLVIDETAQNMTLPVLKKIQALVKAGAKITGIKPEQSPSLSDSPAEFKKIVDEIWNNTNVLKMSTAEAMKTLKVAEDVIISGAQNKILYRHRKEQGANNQSLATDIYWLNSRSVNPTEAEVSFKITGKIPELWNAQTGKTEKVSYQIKDGRTIIPLKFESWDAYFIIFKEKANTLSYKKTSTNETTLVEITSPWKVQIGSKNVSMDKLTNWIESSEAEVKYFSGTAVYGNTFNVSTKNNGKTILDLGEVKNVAEIIMNGKNIGIVWKKPFKIDISEALKVGENKIEIQVTNLWPNRLIGDAQPDVKQKTTFTTMPFYRADSPLLPSGLLGPVRVVEVR